MEDTLRKYEFIEKKVQGKTEYYIKFMDGERNSIRVRVSAELYAEMQRLMQIERNMIRSDERHLEQLDLSDEILYQQIFDNVSTTEQQAIWNFQIEELHETVCELPDAQRRRFILHCEMQFSFEQIARKEGCSKQAVKKSVDAAKKKIRKKMKYFAD